MDDRQLLFYIIIMLLRLILFLILPFIFYIVCLTIKRIKITPFSMGWAGFLSMAFVLIGNAYLIYTALISSTTFTSLLSGFYLVFFTLLFPIALIKMNYLSFKGILGSSEDTIEYRCLFVKYVKYLSIGWVLFVTINVALIVIAYNIV